MDKVAPFVGAWIEIMKNWRHAHPKAVAPFVGAWIEMHQAETHWQRRNMSLPSWERGLKCRMSCSYPRWNIRRSLRGSVD